MRTPALILGLAAVAAPVTAVGQPATSVRDSAGVEIVENRGRLAELPTFRLAPEPTLRIGVVEGDERYMLSRLNWALVLSDGRLVVLNGGGLDVRFYDAAGRFLHAVGGPGEGPGEFRRFARAFGGPGDAVFVYDGDLNRVTRISPDGAVVDVVKMDIAGMPLSYMSGVFADGSMLLGGIGVRRTDDGFSSSTVHLRYGRDGRLLDSLDSYEAGRHVRTEGRFMDEPLFQANPVDAVLSHSYVAAGGTEYRFQEHAADGSLIRSVRWAGPALSVTEEDLTRYWEERGATLSGGTLRRVRQRQETAGVAEKFPALSWIQAGAAGRIWVRMYRRPGVDHGEWLIFDRDGVLRGRAEFPDRYSPVGFQEESVVGILRDELGVEYLTRHELVPARPDP